MFDPLKDRGAVTAGRFLRYKGIFFVRADVTHSKGDIVRSVKSCGTGRC